MTEVAAAAKMSEEAVLDVLRHSQSIWSLNQNVPDELGDFHQLYEALLDPSDAGPDAHVEHAALQAAVEDALDTLPERSATILALRCGLSGGRQLTLDECGKVFGVTRERIRQLEVKAIAELRATAASALIDFYEPMPGHVMPTGGRRRQAPVAAAAA